MTSQPEPHHDLPELPSGWAWTTVGELFRIVGGGTPSTDRADLWNGQIPWITSADIYGLRDIQPRKTITNKALLNSATNLVPEGTIIVVTRVSLGKLAVTPYPLCFSQDSQALLDDFGTLNKDYILYFLSQAVQQFKHMSRGTTISGVTKKQLATLPVPLAPLAEQRRIIEALETQITRLDAAVAALERARANLKRYRASVLKAAVEGRLVPQDPTDEPAADLLARILRERRARWEADQRNKGKDPAKLTYPEPAAPDTSNLPELPEGWCWATVEDICERIVDCLHSTPVFRDAGFICIDTNCIKPGKLVASRIRYVDAETFRDRNRRMRPRAGDVMFSREGALLGVAVVVPEQMELCLGQRMMIFRLAGLVDPRFFEAILNSVLFRSQYSPKIGGSASPHLNISDIRRMAVPVPPPMTQKTIIEALDTSQSVVDELEESVEAGLKRAARLRQSLLREAFAGRLVSQDPNDEPASVLLERIREERAQRTPAARRIPNF